MLLVNVLRQFLCFPETLLLPFVCARLKHNAKHKWLCMWMWNHEAAVVVVLYTVHAPRSFGYIRRRVCFVLYTRTEIIVITIGKFKITHWQRVHLFAIHICCCDLFGWLFFIFHSVFCSLYIFAICGTAVSILHAADCNIFHKHSGQHHCVNLGGLHCF